MSKPDSRSKGGRGREDGGVRALALGAVAAAAAVGFGLLNAAVARRETARVDEAVRRRTAPRRGHPVRRAADEARFLGKWWTYVPGALGASAYVLSATGPEGTRATPSRRSGAAAVVLAGTVATALNPAFDRWLPQPPTPPGHGARRKPVYPSGHAFGPGAVSLATAYVLSREGLARPGTAFPAALVVPLVLAGGRVLEEKHWASDVVGGLLGAVAVAAASLAVYEAATRS